MKKIFILPAITILAICSGFTAKAEDFIVPEPKVIVPKDGVAEHLYNMVEITWGYYGLKDNAGDEPIQATLTFPDGVVKTVKGVIDNANGVETGDVTEQPTTDDNALMFRNFMDYDDDLRPIEQCGTYTLEVPAGIVLVNGVENPAAKLNFTVTGEMETVTMNPATIVYPASTYTSYLSTVQLYYGEGEISFTDGAHSVNLAVALDGDITSDVNATIQTITGGNESTGETFSMDVLYIAFDDFLTYYSVTDVDIYIPEGIIINEIGEVNPEQVISFKLLEQVAGTASPEVHSDLQKGDAEVTLAWQGLQLLPTGFGTVVAKTRAGAQFQLQVSIPDPEAEETNVLAESQTTMKIDLSTLPVGSYEVVVPEAFVIILIEENPVADILAINEEMVLEYTIVEGEANVSELIDESETFKVYSINGTSMMTTHNVTDLNILTPGIYVINGRKFIIRK